MADIVTVTKLLESVKFQNPTVIECLGTLIRASKSDALALFYQH
jgi:hypothetical protein